jgi:hypothetical protein
VAAPAGRDESDCRKSANPDMPELIKRLAQSLNASCRIATHHQASLAWGPYPTWRSIARAPMAGCPVSMSEFHVFRDVFFRSEPVAVHRGKRAAKRR